MLPTIRIAVFAAVVVLALTTPSSLSAATIFVAGLNGASEVPPTGSPATGNSTVTLNGDMLTVNETFSGLIGGPATAAHIHCCGPIGANEPVAVPFTGFPAAASGTYNQSFDLTMLATYTATFVTANGGTAAAAESALIAALNSGRTYANIHNAQFPGGEIRGQLAPVSVPEPGTTALAAGSLLMLAFFRRRRQSR